MKSSLILTLSFMLALVGSTGCQRKKSTPSGTVVATPGAEAETTAIAGLETQQDADNCRNALVQLDNLNSVSTRPVASEEERSVLAQLFRMSPVEVGELTQTTFSQADANYLEECLLIRAGLRSLRLDGRPPLERARLGFDWACRMVYIDARIPWPAPPWMTLQTGSGVAASRMYVILAVWRQLGLDGCVVGPASLAATPSFIADPLPPDELVYAPFSACGVKIDQQVMLFDHQGGQPFFAVDGKQVLTLAQAKTTPDLVKTLRPRDDAEKWQTFLAPPLSSLSRRMDWLTKLKPGNAGAVLFEDVLAQRARFQKDLPDSKSDILAPPGDEYSASRIGPRYANENAISRTSIPLRDLHRIRMSPIERMPLTDLRGNALGFLKMSFSRPFEDLRFSLGSPRDSMLRGQFSVATSSLEETKKNLENARERIEKDKELPKDFGAWSDEFQRLTALMARAERDTPGAVPASQKALEAFRNQPKSLDIERTFVLGTAYLPLSAELMYLRAASVHERAERTQLDDAAQAASHWQNAREWWTRYLEASVRAGTPIPARDAHAKILAARVQQFTKK